MAGGGGRVSQQKRMVLWLVGGGWDGIWCRWVVGGSGWGSGRGEEACIWAYMMLHLNIDWTNLSPMCTALVLGRYSCVEYEVIRKEWFKSQCQQSHDCDRRRHSFVRAIQAVLKTHLSEHCLFRQSRSRSHLPYRRLACIWSFNIFINKCINNWINEDLKQILEGE